MDQASLNKLNLLHPKIRQSAIDAYNEACLATPSHVHPVIDQTIRSFAESDHDYALGRTIVNPDGKSVHKPMGNIITDAKAGQSYHNYGLALDFHLVINGHDSWIVDDNWKTVVGIFEKDGFYWGGNFASLKDYPHLENRLGYKWQGLLKLYQSKEFIPGTNYLNI